MIREVLALLAVTMTDALLAVGAVTVTIGAAMYAPWAGVTVCGLMLCVYSVLFAIAERGKNK